MPGIFEMLDNFIKKEVYRNRTYGNIGEKITHENKKESLNLSPEDREIYDEIYSSDKNRLLGIFKDPRTFNEKNGYINENLNWNGVNIDAPKQIL